MKRQPEPELMDSADEAQAYAQADFSTVNAAMAADVVALAGLGAAPARLRAVDMGTGPADIPIRVARLAPWSITAVDASEAMLALARQAVAAASLADRITLVRADAKATGLAQHGFDVVFSNSILHHLADPRTFWAEVGRLAAPGAAVLIRDLARPADQAAAGRIVEHYAGGESALLKEEFYRSLLAAYTPDEVREQLAAAGLAALEVRMKTDRHLDIFGRLP